MPTIKAALAAAVNRLQNSASPQLDAEILLCHVLAKDRSFLRAWPEQLLTDNQQHDFSALLAKRQHGEPVAYLTGVREFWSREFTVNRNVLIPRPETELIIELGLALIPQDQPWQILDLGTGSGILAITLAAERPLACLTATDISTEALHIAQANAERHQVNTIRFIESDWFADIPAGKFDLIVSNPPYLATDDPHLSKGDLRFEPSNALISKAHGLADITRIAEKARQRLTTGGHLIVEHGYDQGLTVYNIFTRLGYANVRSCNDLAGLPRVTLGQVL